MLALKCLLPGYRALWRKRAALFLDAAQTIARDTRFGWEDGTPVASRPGGPDLAGLASTPGDLELFALVGGAIPPGIERGQFRLLRDLVTRYAFPHLRPDLAPGGGAALSGPAAALTGFHGQHKDTALHIGNPALRSVFVEAFRPKPDDAILDCGAFLGMGEAAVAPLLTAGRIVAIEADRRNANLLARNVAANHPGNVETRHAAVWNTHGGEMALATGEAQANTLVSEIHDGGGREMVPTVSVDGLVSDHGIRRLTMLSLTLNGAEVEALEGAGGVLATHRPRIRLAGWYERDGTPVAALCRPILEAHGYRVHVGPRNGVLALSEEQSG